MKFLTLEKRPTDSVTIAKAVAVGVAVAVPLLGFVAPLVVQYQYATLAPGDCVSHFRYGMGIVESVDDRGNATFETAHGKSRKVPVDELTEL